MLLLLPFVFIGVRVGIAAYAAKGAVARAEHNIQTLDIQSAQQEFLLARSSLETIHSLLQSGGVLRDTPILGTYVRGLEDTVGAAAGTLDGVGDILSTASIVLDALRIGGDVQGSLQSSIDPTRSFNQLTREEKQDLIQKFSNELPRLRLARDKIDLATELWNRVPQNEFAAPLRNALRPLAEGLPRARQALDEAVPLLELMIPLVGYPEPRRYLVALQNDAEIRPGGGFIGTIGTMTWDVGQLSEFSFTDVYNVDNPVSGVWKQVPPEPIQRYLGSSQWFLRDANWSPDIPTSAEKVLDFYIHESELQAHAPLAHPPTTFVALEPGLFRSLLHLTGPITIDGEQYTADNFFEKLEYQVEVVWHQQGVPVQQRKEVISKIGNELAKRIFALPSSRWPEVLTILTDAMTQKQILVYSRDQDVQRLLDQRGWAARTKPTQGDFAWVVDANLAALKTDAAMKKVMTYSVDMKDPNNPVATMTLTYTNTAKGFQDYRFTRYRSYTRVYVPEGSQFISSGGAMQDDLNKTGGRFIPGKVDVMKDLGKTVFGAFWSIEPGATRTLSFIYRLPQKVAQDIQAGNYHLDWMKQAGVDDARLTVDLLFGKNVVAATPPEPQANWGDARYHVETDSLIDRVFEVTL